MSITSGLKRKKKSFPDLTGDGKVTKKDILRGRGIEGFQDGGDAGQDFYNLQKTKPGSGVNIRDFTDFIFDPEDPVDYFMLPLLFFPPAAIAAKLVRVGVKGNKLRKKMAKVEKLQNAKGFEKLKNTATTNPMDTLAAANGLLLGSTRESIKGAATQMGVRNESVDLLYPHRSVGIDEKYPGLNLSSQEMRDARKEDPSLSREEGIGELLYSMKDMPGELAQLGDYYLLDPEGRAVLAEGIRGIPSLVSDAASDADFSRYNPTNMLPDKAKTSVDEILSRTIKNISNIPEGIYDIAQTLQNEPEEMANGGIMYLGKGKEVTGWLAGLTKKAVDNLPKNKNGSVKMNSKEANLAKAEFNAKKKAEAQAKRKETLAANKKEADRKKMLEERADADVAAARGRDRKAYDEERLKKLKEMNELNQPVGPPRPPNGPMPSQGPAIATKVDDANASSGASSGAARKADDAVDDPIQPGGAGGDPNVGTRPFYKKKRYVIPTVGGVIAASLYNPNEEDKTSTGDGTGDSGQVTIYDDDIFNNDPQAKILDKNPAAWAEIMKARIVNDRGIPLDDKGNFTEKPKFMDYLKSLPGAYADKVSRDEDFAKKMIAGFLNMMRPVEGFVPVNSAVQFGDAYLAEETRQADMLPADAKMLEYLKGDDEAFERYLRAEQAKSGVLLADTKPELAQEYYNMLISSLGQTQMPGVNVLDKLNQGQIRLVYNGAPVGFIQVLALMDQNVDVLRDPGFALEEI